MLRFTMIRLFALLPLFLLCAPAVGVAIPSPADQGKVDSPAVDRRAEDAPPNIILVMTDDQGYGDLACHGHPFLKTPNLDDLYSQSMRFTDFQVSPTCAPTRAALMSGLAPFKNGVTHTIVERDRMALTSTTVAEVLKSAGYETAIFGKWHLGDDDPYQPENRGFDEVFIHGAGGIGQKFPGSQSDAPGTSYFNPIIKHNGAFEQTEGYCTDVFFRQALGWIKQESSKTGDDKKPFFAYISTNAPHSPYIVDEQYSNPYKDKCNAQQAAFFGMITNIDDNMGLLMRKLDEWNLADNTLLVFMTDNGSAKGSKVFNAGMRGGKGVVNEGGTHVPLFMRLPGLTTAGVDNATLARHYDILPTLAEVAGAKLPAGRKFDGRSLVPLIEDSASPWPDRYFFFHTGRWAKAGLANKFGQGDPNPDHSKYRSFGVRDEKWRVVNKRLYDLQNDPGEDIDVSKQHPKVAAKMVSAFDQWWDEVRPMMVNEDASLDVPKPFRELFKKQKASTGIPKWSQVDIGEPPLTFYTKPIVNPALKQTEQKSGQSQKKKPKTKSKKRDKKPKDKTAAENDGYDASVPKPTLTNIRYGPHARNTLDFWKAESSQPTPLVFLIHGGGWRGGSSQEKIHKLIDTAKLLENGISVVSINYRLMKHAEDVQPPVKAPMEDSARALQFVRTKATEWNFDKNKIGASGGSAGACTALWLAYHDDLAKTDSDDPVARESSRPNLVAVNRPQTSLDPVQMKQWIPNIKYGAHAFGLDVKDFDGFLAARDRLEPWIKEYSPFEQLSKGDPPTYMFYTIAPSADRIEKDATHSAIFGVELKQRCDELGVPCEVAYPGAPNVKHKTPTDYLIDKLK